MLTALQDLRYAVRTLRKSPLFLSVAVFSLALGIGANTAIFSLVNQLILELLPVKHPEELVLLTRRGINFGSNTGSNAISYPLYQDFRDQNQVFTAMFCKYGSTFSLSFEGRTELVSAEFVSGNYFPVLGVRAAAGRLFTASDDLYQGGHPLAVLSYGFWQARFNGDRSVIGRSITVNGYPLTIIGVSQAGFDGVEMGYSPQIRVPMMMKKELTPGPWYGLNNRRESFVQAFARLKPGMTVQRAKAGLQPLYHQVLDMEVKDKAFSRTTEYTRQQFLRNWMDVLPAAKGRSQLRRQFSNPLWALMAITGLVLLIACSNVANLLVARAAARQKEVAVRLAMGASRQRLIAQLLLESLLLSLCGGAAGLALAILMDRALLNFLPTGTLPLSLSTTPDGRVLGFTVLVSVLTGLLFGLAPALQSTRPELAGTLKDQAGSVLGGTSVGLRKTLVVAQVALSLLLLIGAGLFVQSLRNLRGLNPGFRITNIVRFQANPTLNGYTPSRSYQFYRQLLDRMQGLGGVSSAALAVIPVLDGDEWDSSVTVEGYTAKEGEWINPHMQFASAGYFETLGIPVVMGRSFTRRDDEAAPKVGIINEKFAKRYFGDRNPIGRHIGMGGNPGTKPDIEIVGVVSDTRYESLRDEMPLQFYRPYQQVEFVTGMTAYLRTQADPTGLFPVLRQTVREVDSSVPVYGMRTLEQQADQSLVTERMLASLSAVFGCLATMLAALGLYGVMAYMVARRTREIGIRMALGAAAPSVVWLVMREVLLLSGIGVAIGAPAAWAATRLVATQLFGIKPADPITMVAAVFGIVAVAAFSGYVPARRATGIDPMRALRWE